MPLHASIQHYRLTTGRTFPSPAVDTDEASIAILQPMLIPGRHRLPNTPGYEVETTIAGTCLVATVIATGRLLLRMWVVLDARDLRLAVPPLRQLDISLPACIVENLIDQPFDPSVGWLRALEVTLVWAWVKSSSPTG